MKNRVKWYYIIPIFFWVLIALSFKSEEAYAALVPVESDSSVTSLDASGNLVNGSPISAENVILVKYFGSSMRNDTTVATSTGSQIIPDAGNMVSSIPINSTIKVKNVAMYKGKPVTIVMKNINYGLNSVILSNFGLNFYSLKDKNAMQLQITFLDSEGNKITDPNVRFLLSTGKQFTNTATDGYHYVNVRGNGVKNVLVGPETGYNLNQTGVNAYSSTNFDFSIRAPSFTNINTIISPAVDDVTITFGFYLGSYPSKTVETSPAAYGTNYMFLKYDELALLPLLNQLPIVNETTNNDSFKMKMDIRQTLQVQKNNSFYPENFDIDISLPDYVLTKENKDTIKIKDGNDNDITSQLNISSENEGSVKVSIPKDLLQTLGGTTLSISGEFDLDGSSNKLPTIYDKDTGYFNIPVEASNSDNEDDSNTGTAKVKMPVPTGDPVSQEVGQGSSTKYLDASKFVTNLKSVLSTDTITVEGFETDTVFDKLGSNSVVVKIKSSLTGVESTITVPVTVVESDQAILSWSNKEATRERKETIDKSNVSENIQEEVYWQTTKAGMAYKLVVKKGKTVISSTQTDVADDAGSWISKNLSIPVASLDFGANDLTVGIYRLTDDTTPLDEISLTVTVTGSIKVVSVPNVLSWTDRTTRGSKGTLSRDDGNTMTVSVIDTRNISEASKTWSLRAKTTVTNAVPFDLVWKSDASAETKSLSSEVQVLTKSTGVKNGDTYTKTWDEATGVLLSSPTYMKVDDYSNNVVVNWYLYDTEMP